MKTVTLVLTPDEADFLTAFLEFEKDEKNYIDGEEENNCLEAIIEKLNNTGENE